MKTLHPLQRRIQQRIRDPGYEPLGFSPKEMADRIRAELAQWTTIIRQANIKRDQQ